MLRFSDPIPGVYRHHPCWLQLSSFPCFVFCFFSHAAKGFTIRRLKKKNIQWSASRNRVLIQWLLLLYGNFGPEVSSQNHVQAIQFKSPGEFS